MLTGLLTENQEQVIPNGGGPLPAATLIRGGRMGDPPDESIRHDGHHDACSPRLVVIRGNSASGKSAAAAAIRDRYRRGLALGQPAARMPPSDPYGGVSRSPALTGTSMVFSAGASGHTQRGLYRHDGWYAKLKSMTTRCPSDPRSAPFAVSST